MKQVLTTLIFHCSVFLFLDISDISPYPEYVWLSFVLNKKSAPCVVLLKTAPEGISQDI